MRIGPIISLGLSIVVGIVAVVFGRTWLSNEAEAARPAAEVIVEEVQTEAILVATALINRGDALEDVLFEVKDWPADFIPAGVIKSPSELVLPNGTPTFALGTITPGEPILAAKISRSKPRDTLAGIIEPGFRAVSIEVDDATGVAGFVLPNHRVDVILSREIISRNGAENYRPETLVRNVRVLAVDQAFGDELDGATLARSVTLEVTPTQAGSLTAGADIGRLGLALRAEEDVSIAEPVVRRRRAAPVRRPSRASVRIIEGEEEKTVTTPVARAQADEG
ncbi:MAG: Flp pilus assembly protein CpaB [Pseudomonadota bacterium]